MRLPLVFKGLITHFERGAKSAPLPFFATLDLVKKGNCWFAVSYLWPEPNSFRQEALLPVCSGWVDKMKSLDTRKIMLRFINVERTHYTRLPRWLFLAINTKHMPGQKLSRHILGTGLSHYPFYCMSTIEIFCWNLWESIL